MRPLAAQWVANAVGGELVAPVDIVVSSVEKDTREIAPGALYAAFIGERVDGHDLVPDAMEAGAALCLVSQPVDAPHILVDDVAVALGALAQAYLALLRTEGEITVIGITGSNGKTTTKDLLAQVLPDSVAPVGSYNNEIGLPLTVLRADASTRHLVLEMGASAPGDITYLTRIAPLDIAVVLTVGTAHLGGYGSPEALAREKASLLDGLVPGGVAFLNADDARVAAMAPGPRQEPVPAGSEQSPYAVVTFGVSPGSANRAEGLTTDHGRASFAIGSLPRRTLTLVGEHHVTNALAAYSVALQCGIDASQAWEAVAAARPLSPHRMALTERPDGIRILDDSYNASPESMRAALRALKDVAQGGRAIAVVGEMLEMGEASLAGHEEIGLDAVRLRLDLLLVVGAGARPAYVAAVREGSWGDEAAYVDTIGEAREVLEARAAPGDTVLIKASHGSGLWKLADDLVGDGA